MGGRWRTCGDERVCEACQSQEGGHWTGEAGVPPHPGCTNPDGCRCSLIADEDIAAGVNHLLGSIGKHAEDIAAGRLCVEVLEESGDPSIQTKARIREAGAVLEVRPTGMADTPMAEELPRMAHWDIRPSGVVFGSGFIGGPIEPMVPAPLWRVVLELVLQATKRWRWRRSENWDHAVRVANAKEVDRRRDANRD